MLHAVPWFLLGSLWALLFSEYRAFQQRLKLAAHIHALEAELATRADEQFECEKAYRSVRIELLDLLEVAKSPRPIQAEPAE